MARFWLSLGCTGQRTAADGGVFCAEKVSHPCLATLQTTVCKQEGESPLAQHLVKQEVDGFCHLQSMPAGPFPPPILSGEKGILSAHHVLCLFGRRIDSSKNTSGLRESDPERD